MRTSPLNAAAFNLSAFTATLAVAHMIYSYKHFSSYFHVPIQRDSSQRPTNLKTHIAWKALAALTASTFPIALGAFVFKPKCANSAHLFCITSFVHFCLLAMQKHSPKIS